jgi:ketosteroid isomerase-like protein
MRFVLGAMLFTVIGAARPALAQSNDSAAVVATVTRFFDGLRARDTALIRSTVTDGATLLTTGGASGVASRETMEDFIATVGKATGPMWDEQIVAPVVRIDGPFASVWTRYTFTLGTTFSHCGVDAVHLVRVGEAWKIRHMSDSRRNAGCPDAASQDEAPGALAAAQAFLDGLNARDTAAIRRVVDSGAVFLVAGGPGGVSSRTEIGELLPWLATSTDRFDERMVQPEVRVDGPLAEVWAPYTFGLNGAFSHCGADGFQLAKGAEGWKVVLLTYNTRREGCESLRR